MVRCSINLENNLSACYTAGELLKGTIELHLDNPKKIRAFWFVVYGAAKCHWTETRTTTSGSGKNRRTHRHTVHYKGKDVYINQKTFLFGSDGAAACEMASGTYKYDFACQLPDRLPASYQANHGSITYNIEAVMDIPWAFDKEFKLEFTVVRKDDLNSQPDLKIPVKSEEIKQFCCLFCESEPLIMTVTLPYSGFARGQVIPVSIDLVNRSNVDVIDTDIYLKRITRYLSYSPHSKMKYETDRMVEMNAPGVKSLHSTKIEKSLLVPNILLPTNTQYCNVVQISYILKIKANTTGCNGNAELEIPITIGTVPLIMASAPSNTEIASTPFISSQVTYPIMPSAPNGFNQNNIVNSERIEDLPPSYNEAVEPGNIPIATSDVKLDLSAPSGSSFGWNVQGAESPSTPEKK